MTFNVTGEYCVTISSNNYLIKKTIPVEAVCYGDMILIKVILSL